MARDAAALPVLTAVMEAAGRHDAQTCLRLLDEAEGHLGAGPHKARIDIDRARAAIESSDWLLVWSAAHAATCGLTWAFPPDVSKCPPAPGAEPYGADVTCGCGQVSPAYARFCSTCGAGL